VSIPVDSDFDPSTTVQQARDWLNAHAEDPGSGVTCPCCGQRVKVYRRTITSAMALALILIERRARAHNNEWFHVPSYLSATTHGAAARGGDWSKLRYWGMLQQLGDVRPDGSTRTGMWRMTDMGVDFVHERISVPKVVLVYNQTLLGHDSAQWVTIREALTAPFNYDELIGGDYGDVISRPRPGIVRVRVEPLVDDDADDDDDGPPFG
jgi:hypothetical protein